MQDNDICPATGINISAIGGDDWRVVIIKDGKRAEISIRGDDALEMASRFLLVAGRWIERK